MNDLLKVGQKNLISVLNTRTGFLGLGPTYGVIIADHILEYTMRRFEEKSVVKEAEKVLADIDNRNRMF